VCVCVRERERERERRRGKCSTLRSLKKVLKSYLALNIMQQILYNILSFNFTPIDNCYISTTAFTYWLTNVFVYKYNMKQINSLEKCTFI